MRFADLKVGQTIRMLSHGKIYSEFIVLEIEVCGGMNGNNALLWKCGEKQGECNPEWQCLKNHYNIIWEAAADDNAWKMIDFSN